MKADTAVEKQRTVFPQQLAKRFAFRTVFTGPTAVKPAKQQNRTFHLLQKPDIFICYRHR
jgi:hypothetical protein